MLAVPPIHSPQDAVRASIVAEAQKKNVAGLNFSGADIAETDNVMPKFFGLMMTMRASCFSGVLNDSFA